MRQANEAMSQGNNHRVPRTRSRTDRQMHTGNATRTSKSIRVLHAPSRLRIVERLDMHQRRHRLRIKQWRQRLAIGRRSRPTGVVGRVTLMGWHALLSILWEEMGVRDSLITDG